MRAIVRVLALAITASCVIAEQPGAHYDRVINLSVVPGPDDGAHVTFETHGAKYALDLVREDSTLADESGDVLATSGRNLVVDGPEGSSLRVPSPDLARLLLFRRGKAVGLLGSIHYAGRVLTLSEARDTPDVSLVAEMRSAGEALRDPLTNAPLRCGSHDLGHNRSVLSQQDTRHEHHGAKEESVSLLQRVFALFGGGVEYARAVKDALVQGETKGTRETAAAKTNQRTAKADRDGTVRAPKRRPAGHEGRIRQANDDPAWLKHSGERMAGCPATPRLLPVAIVGDCNYVARVGGVDAARRQLLAEMNVVSGIFLQAFNIGLAVTQLLLYAECDGKELWGGADVFNVPCGEYPGLEVALNRFSKWRDTGLGDADAPSAALVHLVTACNYSDRVGLAWLNQVCRTRSFTDSMADTVSGTSLSVAIFPADPYWGDRSPKAASKGRAHTSAGTLNPRRGMMYAAGTPIEAFRFTAHSATNSSSPPSDPSSPDGMTAAAAAGATPMQHYAIIAHELAHNLGATHDCTDASCSGTSDAAASLAAEDIRDGSQCCKCTDGPNQCSCGDRFLMTPNIGRLLQGEAAMDNGRWSFSPCTVTDVCGKLAYLGTCLVDESGGQDRPAALAVDGASSNAPRTIAAASVQANLIATCGNGVREGDEECDAGGAQDDPCCTPACKLRDGAVCSDANDMCCQKCRVVPRSEKVLCRPSSSQDACMLDAYCDGQSAGCPPSRPKPDGASCGPTRILGDTNGGGACASGICTSRDEQCAVFGRHLQMTAACPYTKRSCSVICQGANVCVDLHANFVDGTPCGVGGQCHAGMCSEFGSSVQPPPRSALWLALSIALAPVVADVARFFL